MINTKEDLKNYRLKLGMSKEQFAKAIGYSFSYVDKVEKGRLEFYGGIKKAVNEYAERLEAYKRAGAQYAETVERLNTIPQKSEADNLAIKLFWICYAILGLVSIWICLN